MAGRPPLRARLAAYDKQRLELGAMIGYLEQRRKQHLKMQLQLHARSCSSMQQYNTPESKSETTQTHQACKRPITAAPSQLQNNTTTCYASYHSSSRMLLLEANLEAAQRVQLLPALPEDVQKRARDLACNLSPVCVPDIHRLNVDEMPPVMPSPSDSEAGGEWEPSATANCQFLPTAAGVYIDGISSQNGNDEVKRVNGVWA